ncbi:YceD family protein [Sorangium sp. So ce887]|uniref:YceD family protein n=1 Tax=Sorangium sp. So ce887 TaxID=3133324 RepID=UPI003F644EF2
MSKIALSANDIDLSGTSLEMPLPTDWLNAELADVNVTSRAPGQLSARLSRTGNEIVVRGRVKASVAMPCARCLSPAALDIDAELSLLLRPAPKAEGHGHGHRRDDAGHGHRRDDAGHGHRRDDAGHNGATKAVAKTKEPEYEFSADEADVDTYDGETVVLDPFIREAILLEMPNFPLCSEACPGIGPAASREDREGGSSTLARGAVEEDEAAPGLDPRLAPLSALREKLGQKPGGSDRRAQPASTSPAKAGTPKKKTKKE